MIKGKKRRLSKVELIKLRPLKRILVNTRKEPEAKVKARARKPEKNEEKINLQVLTKLIEHIEKKL